MTSLKEELIQQLQEVKFNEPLSKYSTFHIGGPADFFYKLKDHQLLASIIQYCQAKHLPYFIIGGGSNILFDDKGFRGLIIKMETDNIKIQEEKIIADAGLSIAALIKAAMKYNLQGMEQWVGLPGTVGAAVRGNAGCNGLETKDVLTHALILNPYTGETKDVNEKYFKFKYRSSKLKKTGEIVLNATFRFKKRTITKQQQHEIMKAIRTSRIAKQPFGSSLGSFFQNPSVDNPAGLLIEKVGLKGHIIGKAQISEKHANFILNLGNASTKDIIQLARLAREKVSVKFKIKLKEEVQILSETGPTTL